MKFETNPEKGSITLRGGIGDFDNHISANDFMEALEGHTGDLTIHLDSGGGSVTDGISIYNQMKQYEGKITVHIDSICASIATVIACGADHVKANSKSKYMIHRAWTAAMGNCSDFRSMADIMELMDADIAETYAAKAGGSKEEWLNLMDKETWFSAEQALEAGLIDEIVNLDDKEDKPYKAEAEPQAIQARVNPAKYKAYAAALRGRLKLRK